MKTKPILSVHLLTYNCQDYIEETLLSILNQKTSFLFEIVIGDDKSTDQTPKILNTYLQKYPEIIKYEQNKTQLGILKNFKKTLDRCQGDYIFDIVGDDYLTKNYALEKFVEAFKNDPNLGFIDSGYDTLFSESKRIKTYSNKESITSSQKKYEYLALTGQIYPIGICYNKFYLLKYVNFNKYIEMNISIEDYPILVDLIMNTPFKRIDESLCTYRIHNSSYSHQKKYKLQLALNNQMLDLVKYFSTKYNLSKHILADYKILSNKSALSLASYYGDHLLGKQKFKELKNNRSMTDIINYLSSQYLIPRKLHLIFRKIK